MKIYLKLNKNGNIKRHFPYLSISTDRLYKELEYIKYSFNTYKDLLILTTDFLYIGEYLKKLHIKYHSDLDNTTDLNIDILKNLSTNKINENDVIKQTIKYYIRSNLRRIRMEIASDEDDINLIYKLILNTRYTLKDLNDIYLTVVDNKLKICYYSPKRHIDSCTTYRTVPIYKYNEIIYLFMLINFSNIISDITYEQKEYISNKIHMILNSKVNF